MREVEIKFRSEDSYPSLKNKISELCDYVGSLEQTDIYYTSRFRDFIATEECLRLRSTPEFVEITWKPPTTSEMKAEKQFWKEEVDLKVDDLETARTLLSKLDFEEYSIVRKNRDTFRYDAETTIVIDRVESAGLFVEIETFSDDATEASAKNRKIAADVGLSDAEVINTPYRDLVVRP